MKIDEPPYYSNPYLPESRVGKGEKISMIRATILFCLTILLSVVVVTFFNTQHDRFIVVPHSEGLYIFDRTTTATNYCTTDKCTAISTEFITPKQVLVAQIPGMAPAGQVAQPAAAQQQSVARPLINPNFSMPGMNKTRPANRIQQSRMLTGNQQGPILNQIQPQSDPMDTTNQEAMMDSPMANNDNMDNAMLDQQDQDMGNDDYQNFQ